METEAFETEMYDIHGRPVGRCLLVYDAAQGRYITIARFPDKSMEDGHTKKKQEEC